MALTMPNLTDNRLVRTFAELRSASRRTVMPFLTAGYPDAETTVALLADFERRGVRICELGVPFSDPIADGPTIQATYTEAIAAGVSSRTVFDVVRRYREGGGAMAIAAMVSFSIVYRHGVEAYVAALKAAGADAMIVPDLPLDEVGAIEPAADAAGLANVLLIAPTTPPPRRVQIARSSRGFIYYVSVAGITGERDRLPEQTVSAVAELREQTDTPICVGFGISRPEMVAGVCRVADGAIVGSAILHRITDSKGAPRGELVERVGGFVGELLAPLR